MNMHPLAVLALSCTGLAGCSLFGGQASPLPATLPEETSPVTPAMVPVYQLPAAPNIFTQGRKGEAYRFAESTPVDISPLSHGIWSSWDEQHDRWRLDLNSPGAKSLNLHFDRFVLPAGARLQFYDPDTPGEVHELSSRNNKPHQQQWTPQFPGENLRIDLILPTQVLRTVDLHLATVNIAFR